MLQHSFEFPIPEKIQDDLLRKLNPLYIQNQFNKIIEFICGKNPADVKDSREKRKPGSEICLALIYQGVNAVSKIRSVLGSTDPSKAAPATVRKEFGQDIMVNTAHASDSLQNAEREIQILDIAGNDIKTEINAYLRQRKNSNKKK